MNRPLVFCAVFVAGCGMGWAIAWLMLDPGAPLPAFTAEEGRTPIIGETDGPRSAPRDTVAPIRTKSLKEATANTIGESGAAAPVGSGRITGRVKNEKGEALAGVVVRADFRGDRSDRAPRWKAGDPVPPDIDVQEHVTRAIEDFERTRAMRRDATTASSGEYVIEGLVDDVYGVQAYLKGYKVTPERNDAAWQARPGMTIDFLAAPVVVLPIDVRLPDGSAPKRASIAIKTGNTTTGDRWTPGNADLRLAAGAYTLSVEAGDRDEWRSEKKDVLLKDGVAPEPLKFTLVARTGIRGKIKLPKGYSFDSLQVYSVRYSGSAVPDESALRQGSSEWASAWNGYEFNIEDIAAGTYLLGVGTWESVFATKTVEVAANTITETVIEVTDAGPGGLTVRVVNAEGQPITDVRVNLEAIGDRLEAAEGFSARPYKDGAWVVVAKKEGANASECAVSISSERYGSKTVPLPATLAGELKVEMAEPAALDVTLTGYVGSGLEGKLSLHAAVIVAGKEKKSRYTYSSRSDALGPDGRQSFKALQPGRYRVELQYRRERWSGMTIERADVDVAPGSNAVTIAVPVLHTLVVSVGTDAADGTMNLQMIGAPPGEASWSSAKVGSDGNATFEGLVAGTYRLSLYGKTKRGRSMKVTVPSPGVVSFQEQKENALAFKALDAEGYLASIGIAVGDLLIGVEGTAFDGSRPASQVMFGMLSLKKEVRLMILRGAKTLEITADAEKLMSSANLGNNLEPVNR